jgi:hypothetical protein
MEPTVILWGTVNIFVRNSPDAGQFSPNGRRWISNAMMCVETSGSETESEVDTALERQGSLFTVQLIHETLRSYLTRSSHCPKGFYMDEENADCDVLRVCLTVLSSETKCSNLPQYAEMKWGESPHEYQNIKANVQRYIGRFIRVLRSKMWISFGLITRDAVYFSKTFYPIRELALRKDINGSYSNVSYHGQASMKVRASINWKPALTQRIQ